MTEPAAHQKWSCDAPVRVRRVPVTDDSLNSENDMKRLITWSLLLGMTCAMGAGCAEKSTTTSEKTISTPGGTTKVTEKQEVKKTGDNPP